MDTTTTQNGSDPVDRLITEILGTPPKAAPVGIAMFQRTLDEALGRVEGLGEDRRARILRRTQSWLRALHERSESRTVDAAVAVSAWYQNGKLPAMPPSAGAPQDDLVRDVAWLLARIVQFVELRLPRAARRRGNPTLVLEWGDGDAIVYWESAGPDAGLSLLRVALECSTELGGPLAAMGEAGAALVVAEIRGGRLTLPNLVSLPPNEQGHAQYSLQTRELDFPPTAATEGRPSPHYFKLDEVDEEKLARIAPELARAVDNAVCEQATTCADAAIPGYDFATTPDQSVAPHPAVSVNPAMAMAVALADQIIDRFAVEFGAEQRLVELALRTIAVNKFYSAVVARNTDQVYWLGTLLAGLVARQPFNDSLTRGETPV